MGFFTRRKDPADQFDSDRLKVIPLMLGAAAQAHATEHNLQRSLIATSKFYCGYLAGFPTMLDDLDQEFGASIRRFLFLSTFGSPEGEEIFQRTLGHIMLKDQQVRRGADAGEMDGKIYLNAVKAGKDAQESLGALRTAFKLGLITVSEQV